MVATEVAALVRHDHVKHSLRTLELLSDLVCLLVGLGDLHGTGFDVFVYYVGGLTLRLLPILKRVGAIRPRGKLIQ